MHLTVRELIELHLVEHIEDRKGKDGKCSTTLNAGTTLIIKNHLWSIKNGIEKDLLVSTELVAI